MRPMTAYTLLCVAFIAAVFAMLPVIARETTRVRAQVQRLRESSRRASAGAPPRAAMAARGSASPMALR